MCAGIRDAANLAWKLEWVAAGAAGEPRLDPVAASRTTSLKRALASPAST